MLACGVFVKICLDFALLNTSKLSRCYDCLFWDPSKVAIYTYIFTLLAKLHDLELCEIWVVLGPEI